MSGRVVPETANRQDWPRLVSQGHKDHENRLRAVEAPATLVLTPGDAPASPAAGTIYYDQTDDVLKCWDGSVWNDLW